MTSIRRRIMMKDPSQAIDQWIAEGHPFGQLGNGVIFCSSEKDVNLYMRIIETGTFPPYDRVRAFNGSVSYRTGSLAKLDVMPIRSTQDVSHLAPKRWPFMVFHNPAAWPDRTPIRLLLPYLSPAIGAHTTLVSVGTELASLPDMNGPDTPKPKEIDWMAITRAISNG